MKPSFLAALPFWASLLFLPMVWAGAVYGSPMISLTCIYVVVVFSALDLVTGNSNAGLDPASRAGGLFWYRLITLIWLPIQLVLIFGTLWWIQSTAHLSQGETVALMASIGLISGVGGIVYAHELMHQSNRIERGLGEALMITVLYGHFVTEHLRVHHRFVGTPKDAATARYNESFYHFLPRVLFQSLVSAWRVEADLQRQRGRPILHRSNPFWRYLGGAATCLILAYGIGGIEAVILYLVQAGVAIFVLEQINYVEHYGLVRQRRGPGRYEPVAPHHSWNADHRATNYLLINLQRHSDHHVKPARRFPVLQTYAAREAPQLPAGYPLMVLLSYNPWLWRRVMNPRVRKWRTMFYPEITDWRPEVTGG